MISLAPLALLAIIGMAIWAAVDRGQHRPADVGRMLNRWLDAGLITPEQAAAVQQFEGGRQALPTASPRRIPVVAEALGYIGGSLGIVGLALLTAHYWPDVPTWARLGIGIAAAVALTAAGAMMPQRGEGSLDRVRQFVWTAATGGVALAAAVAVLDVAGSHDGAVVALAVGGAMSIHSGVLWRGAARPMQQAICMIAGLVAVGAVVGQWATRGPVALTVWAFALGLVAAGLWHVVTSPELTILIGGTGAMVGAAMLSDRWHGAGLLLALGTATTFDAIALAQRPISAHRERIVMSVVAAVSTVGTLPTTLMWFSRQAGLATGLTMWAVGVAALAAARTEVVRLRTTMRCLGGLALVGGGALTGAQSVAFATIFGGAVAVVLVALATMPEHALLSIFGSLGLLVNVPWAIHHFFPGEGRVPLLILVCGVLIVGVAVWLTKLGGELHHEFHMTLRHHR